MMLLLNGIDASVSFGEATATVKWLEMAGKAVKQQQWEDLMAFATADKGIFYNPTWNDTKKHCHVHSVKNWKVA